MSAVKAASAILFLVAGTSLNMGASASDVDVAQIRALEQRYNDGFNAKNVEQVMSCYARDNLFVFDVVPPREYASWDAYKRDWQELFATYPGPVKNVISEQTITAVGPIGYGHNIETGDFTRKDGTKLEYVVRTTDIYRKVKGKWLIAEEHNSIPVDLDTMKPDPLSKP
jgi:uncharacterized protein (TIGR02246 family)